MADFEIPDWASVTFDPAVYEQTGYLEALVPWRDMAGMECCLQFACGLAFDVGREHGNLELRQVLLDAEMLRDCDERAREEIERQREELRVLRAALRQLNVDRASVDDDWPASRHPDNRAPVLTPEMLRVLVEAGAIREQRQTAIDNYYAKMPRAELERQ